LCHHLCRLVGVEAFGISKASTDDVWEEARESEHMTDCAVEELCDHPSVVHHDREAHKCPSHAEGGSHLYRASRDVAAEASVTMGEEDGDRSLLCQSLHAHDLDHARLVRADG